VLAALSMGIPQLCLPQAADQFLNAAAVAHGVADEIASMPSPEAVVDVLETLGV